MLSARRKRECEGLISLCTIGDASEIEARRD